MKEFYKIIFNNGIKTAFVNSITLCRIIACPILLFLFLNHNFLFKWILVFAFITDALDGYLAKKMNVITKTGAKLDSIADDCLFIVCLIAMICLHGYFILEKIIMISFVLSLFTMKIIFLWIKHKKLIGGLHTYGSKFSAFLQAIFFIDCFFFFPNYYIFFITCLFTIVAIIEEIIIIYFSKELKQNVNGIFFNNTNYGNP